MNKKLVFGMGALILLAGFVGFQINDQGITPAKIKNLVFSEKTHPDLISNPDKTVIDSLLDGITPGKEYQQYLIYENCTIEANQMYRIDRENYNVYGEENNTLCLIKEIMSAEQFKKLNEEGKE